MICFCQVWTHGDLPQTLFGSGIAKERENGVNNSIRVVEVQGRANSTEDALV